MDSTHRMIVGTIGGLAFVVAMVVAPTWSQAAVPRAERPPCTVTGTPGPDRLVGTPADDVICGLGGDDTILGGGGHDRIYGGGGNDGVDGGAGQDRISGGPGHDTILGGADDDVISGGDGHDAMDGGDGDDNVRGRTGDDRIAGADGDDTLVGGPGTDDIDQDKPLQANPPWEVNVIANYGLPNGTTVVWTYDPPSGNCLNWWNSSWTYKVGDPLPSTELFQTNMSGSCLLESSRGTWKITATTPSGYSRTGWMTIETGLPNIYVHHAEARCQFPAGFTCSGGSDSQRDGSGHAVTPSVYIGPIDEPAPPEPYVAPRIQCTGSAHFKVGEVWTETNGHLCTLEGVPRPTFVVTGLPPGITAARWPTEKDTWIVFRGTVTQPWSGNIQIDAKVGDWSNFNFFDTTVD